MKTKNVNLKLSVAEHRLLADLAAQEFIPTTMLLRKLFLTHAKQTSPQLFQIYLDKTRVVRDGTSNHKKPSTPDVDLEGIEFDE
jgi:hypothetical protein